MIHGSNPVVQRGRRTSFQTNLVQGEPVAIQFKDDLFKPPDWAQDGAIPKLLDPLNGFDPDLPDWPAKTHYPWWVNPFNTGPPPQPSEPIPGYPWWVDPHGFPRPAPRRSGPSDLPLPSVPQGQRSSIEPSQDATTNRLLSYYNQNFVQRGAPQSSNGLDPASQDVAFQQEPPERRLGRRTYRA